MIYEISGRSTRSTTAYGVPIFLPGDDGRLATSVRLMLRTITGEPVYNSSYRTDLRSSDINHMSLQFCRRLFMQKLANHVAGHRIQSIASQIQFMLKFR
jgi:hypothetical protein